MHSNFSISMPACSRTSQHIAFRLLSVLLFPGALVGCHCTPAKTEPPCFLSMPRELQKTTLPDYVIEPPDILTIESSESLPGRPIAGERLVRSDGSILLPSYGELYVVGLTPRQAEDAIADLLEKYLTDRPRVSVDVASYNSKFYYVLGEIGRPGRYPVTGNETVLDALALAGGPSPFANKKKILLVRPGPAQFSPVEPDTANTSASNTSELCCPGGQVLEVNFQAVIECGDTTTNYQLLPGDRIVVKPSAAIAIDRRLAPILNLIERPLSIGVLADVLANGNGSGSP